MGGAVVYHGPQKRTFNHGVHGGARGKAFRLTPCSSAFPVVNAFSSTCRKNSTTGSPPSRYPRRRHSHCRRSADVAIIGAGFTGLSAALSLAKRGARVVVLESETIGWGASSRNGGMVLTGLKLGVNKLISIYGRELTRRMYAASLESIDAVERIVKEESIACDFSRTGHLEVACKQAHFDDYARQVEVIAMPPNSITGCASCLATNSAAKSIAILRRHG